MVARVAAPEPVELVPAASFSLDELARLLTASFEGYVVPMNVDEATFRRMVELFDLNLDASRVAIGGGQPVGLVNVALRGTAAWIGGMGVVAQRRCNGLGARLMHAAHEAAFARGACELWLEVITSNVPAIRLYEKLGYEHVRDLEFWTIEPDGAPASPAREVEAREAHTRVRALRTAPEPWQRADETLDRLLAEDTVFGLVADGAAAVARTTGGGCAVEQIAATTVDAAADLLAGALTRGGTLRLSNIPAGSETALALARSGNEPSLRQHELRLALG